MKDMSPAENRTTRVVDHLTHAIVSQEIAANVLLPPERKLAESLGVSRNVVREATKILQSRGLVTIRQGSGTLVNGITSEPVRQVMHQALDNQEDTLPKLLEVRLVLEVEIARLTAQRRTKEDLNQLRALLDEFALNLEDLPRCAQLDVAFHQSLAKATHNPLFALMLEPLVNLLQESRLQSLQDATTLVSHRHHEKIYQAVEKRQPSKASHLMREHLGNPMTRLSHQHHEEMSRFIEETRR